MELPRARTTERGIVLGEFEIILDGVELVPMHECHPAGSDSWMAFWKVLNGSPGGLLDKVHQGLVDLGFKLGAAFPPAQDGRNVWVSEAWKEDFFVKVHVAVEPNYKVLELVLDRSPTSHGMGR